MKKKLRYISTILLISAISGFPDGALAAAVFKQPDYGIFSINSIFPSGRNMECNTTEQLRSSDCINNATDGFSLGKLVEHSFRLKFYLNGHNLREHLPLAKTAFDCIKNRCGRYAFMSDDDRNVIVNGGDKVLNFLSCLLNVNEESYQAQSHAAWKYYLENPDGIKTYNILTKSIQTKRLTYLFVNNGAFSECSHLELSNQALELLSRLELTKRLNTF